MTDLEDLLARVNAESINLKAQTQTDTLLAKINQLGLMKDELSEYIRKLKGSPPQMTLSQVPITKEQADVFLASLDTGNYTVLFTKSSGSGGAPAPATRSPSAITSGSGGFDQLLGNLSSEETQGIFNRIQDIKWNFQLSYDPQTSRESKLLDRLEALEKKIVEYSNSSTAIPDELKKVFTYELQLISEMIRNPTRANTRPVAGKPRAVSPPRAKSGRTPSGAVRKDERVYDYSAGNSDISYSDDGESVLFGTPRTSADVRIRPGYAMTDEQIRKRASAAAFLPQMAGGADYKQRAKELCSQIRGAGIGEPSVFGCIDNPAEVSASYSWKGNYNMICNRLGDMWAPGYPEMFGCPKSTPGDKYNGSML